MNPSVICITDCTDTNARARLAARIGALFGSVPAVLPLDGAEPELSAGLTLLDVLLSTQALGTAAQPTVILVNVAPRDGSWHNGAPFCYFRVGSNLVVSTFSARLLSFVRRSLDVACVEVTDIRTVMTAAAEGWATFTATEVETISATQFRSLWYQPLVASWVFDGRPVPSSTHQLTQPVEFEPTVVAFVDNFGNCKLNHSSHEIDFAVGSHLKVRTYEEGRAAGLRAVTCYPHLTAVPRHEPGLIVGSSGQGLAELVVRSGSAAEQFGLQVGYEVF
ncbi:SAM hydroxide adenosyltransferase [Catellatospora tritici]|uniref:SAM hydroxide adenosyltransferase n=1 Tax=Catellatospora tritici TaxID=2851566 RepID=UPI001C2D818D|nr:SAM hydroxide adenosyltransferase [Catellatospora tritici]MBV1850001.1 SAM-dependent chlorinase/fluorinase [Catellatospora tritici]